MGGFLNPQRTSEWSQDTKISGRGDILSVVTNLLKEIRLEKGLEFLVYLRCRRRPWLRPKDTLIESFILEDYIHSIGWIHIKNLTSLRNYICDPVV